MGNIILVTGAARSGKSEWAETLAMQSQLAVVYVATAQMDETDAEWQARIARHQQRRPTDWATVHVPIELAKTIQQSDNHQCLLVDSLGTWLANRLEENERAWESSLEELLVALTQASSTVIIVAEETGWGVVPAYPLGRTFRDRLGTLTRTVGTLSSAVYLVATGFAINLTQLGTPVHSPTLSQSGKDSK